MAKDKIKKNGQVIETLPNLLFRVRLEDGKEILAHLGGKLKIHRIKVLSGDRVLVEIGPYDQNRGIIVYRLK
ncbi:translation initiation factor IF-1 [bacterium]|nr:translation initiation factor IF-1 [bacterium]